MSNKSQRGNKPQKKSVAKEREYGLDDHFTAALKLNPLATVAVGALHGINSFLESFMLGNPPARSVVAVNLFLGTFFTTIGESYFDRAREVPGFEEIEKELDDKRETDKAVSTSSIIIPGTN
jgi:hypothetical protein